jgi:hypothetical protein
VVTIGSQEVVAGLRNHDEVACPEIKAYRDAVVVKVKDGKGCGRQDNGICELGIQPRKG